MSALGTNLATAARARERRNAAVNTGQMDPFQAAQSAYAGPGWDAFFGSFQDQAEAGYTPRVNWSGFGNTVGGSVMPRNRGSLGAYVDEGALNPLEQQTMREMARAQMGNQAVGQAQIERAVQQDYADARQRDILGSLRSMYDQGLVDAAFAPPEEPTSVQRVNGGPGATDTLLVQPEARLDERTRQLRMLPPHLRPAYEKQYAEMDAKAQMADAATTKAKADEMTAQAALEKVRAPAQPDNDVALAVSGMKDGTLPPILPGRASKEYVNLLGEAKRQGYDLAQAATDWSATQKHIQTMNGAQQLRLNQAINALPEMLDSVEGLAQQWKAGQFPMLNKANLALAKNGALGEQASSIANKLDAQIADVVADLGNVYMGGNSPTDHALSLAEKSLKADWSEKTLIDMVGLAKKNVQIRRNSIANTGVSGASAGNPYAGSQPRAPEAAAPDQKVNLVWDGSKFVKPGGGQ